MKRRKYADMFSRQQTITYIFFCEFKFSIFTGNMWEWEMYFAKIFDIFHLGTALITPFSLLILLTYTDCFNNNQLQQAT